MMKATSIVLYVEDEEMDRFLMGRAFGKEGLGTALQMVNDGQAAIDYLLGSGHYSDREKHPLPAVVLLDLNLPEVHGFEVLKWIRAHPVHLKLPVVIFSSSEREEDQEKARLLGATEFVKKPGSGLSFRDVVRKLNERWLSRLETTVTSPPARLQPPASSAST
ncbi:MAG TPA: response regulator [Clostridia bacterium]|nr:response regulator [Clostridia bacterium]